MDDRQGAYILGGSGCLLVVIAGCVFLGMWGCPQYTVYQQRLEGEAKLREAESSRQIAVEEAKAKKEAAKMLAEAEVERARGVAEANRIVGDSLKENHEYLMYLWIQELSDNTNNVIYVPTEGSLPILEAGRFFKAAQTAQPKK